MWVERWVSAVPIVTCLVNKIKPQNYLQIHSPNRHIHSVGTSHGIGIAGKPFLIHPLLISCLVYCLQFTHSTQASKRKCENYTCLLRQPSTVLRLSNKHSFANGTRVRRQALTTPHAIHTRTLYAPRDNLMRCQRGATLDIINLWELIFTCSRDFCGYVIEHITLNLEWLCVKFSEE